MILDTQEVDEGDGLLGQLVLGEPIRLKEMLLHLCEPRCLHTFGSLSASSD